MSHKVVLGDIHSAHEILHGLYFESAAMILVLITLGKYLESRSKGKTKNALKGLIDLSPKMATIIKDGEEITVGIDEIRVGDIIAVKPGESFPADAKIIFGSTAADESALTGESIPVDKSVGDTVYTATINQSGYVKCEVLKIGDDTALASIIKSVTDASASKAPIAKLADKVSGIFVPIVIIISVITTLVWLFVGEDIGYSLARGISVLVISCPCALGLATPVAVMVSSGKGARSGILFKNAASIEEIGKISVVALDKTGTLTEGRFKVSEVMPESGFTAEDVIRYAAAVESGSTHPIGAAIAAACDDPVPQSEITGEENHAGKGIIANVSGTVTAVGNLSFMEELGVKPSSEHLGTFAAATSGIREAGTMCYVARDGKYIGAIAVSDMPKPEAKKAIKDILAEGVRRIIMLTGDSKETARAVAEYLGITDYAAGLLPQDKVEYFEKLLAETGGADSSRKIAFIGDGINDAPVLSRADVGIAMGSLGSDAAIEAADVVIMDDNLERIPAVIRIARKTIGISKANIVFALLVKFTCLVLGALGIANMWAAVFADVGVCVICILNSMRLLLMKKG
jgi:Cu2+-exporting ATPase